MREIVNLFSERESRDELGIGQVRDAISDLMWPGTSTLFTRARYFLFIPWCLRDHPELRNFSPWWIYPGDARVERLVVHFPLSREDAQYQRLRDSRALCRMMLGQPRQEDMMELLQQRGGWFSWI